MNEIKEYKQLTMIQLFEWEVFTTASIDELDTMLNSDSKFIRIWNEIIAKNQIRKCSINNIDDMENYILSFNPYIQKELRRREKEKKNRVWRWFDSKEEINNWLKKSLDIVA